MLFLNWKDSSNPQAGGAEAYTEEIGKRLASQGNEVTLFTASYPGCEPETYKDGIRTVRDGGRYTVYGKARRFARSQLSDTDIIVDEINTIPFRVYTLAKRKPVVALIHQLAREIWFHEVRFPLSFLGYYALEPLWLRGYRKIPTITVSDSSKKDLVTLGFERVGVIHNGIGVKPLEKPPSKVSHPVLIFLGRLVKCKLPGHAIEAFKLVKSKFPEAELWVLGDGYLRTKLEGLSVGGVRFFGRVGNERKFELLKQAHVLLAPSIREGWGNSVIEANAMGTPAVAYAVPGLLDSVVQGRTGLLVEPRNVAALANAATTVIEGFQNGGKLAANAIEWSGNFSWDKSSRDFEQFLQTAIALG